MAEERKRYKKGKIKEAYKKAKAPPNPKLPMYKPAEESPGSGQIFSSENRRERIRRTIRNLRRQRQEKEQRRQRDKTHRKMSKDRPISKVMKRETTVPKKEVFKNYQKARRMVFEKTKKASERPERIPLEPTKEKRIQKGLRRAAARAGKLRKGMRVLGPITDIINLPDIYRTFKHIKKQRKNYEKWGTPHGGRT